MTCKKCTCGAMDLELPTGMKKMDMEGYAATIVEVPDLEINFSDVVALKEKSPMQLEVEAIVAEAETSENPTKTLMELIAKKFK